MTLLTNLLLIAFASAAQTVPTEEQTETAEVVQPAAAEPAKEKKICRYRRARGIAGEKRGASVPMAKVCRTKADWDAEKSDKDD